MRGTGGGWANRARFFLGMNVERSSNSFSPISSRFCGDTCLVASFRADRGCGAGALGVFGLLRVGVFALGSSNLAGSSSPDESPGSSFHFVHLSIRMRSDRTCR